MSSNYVEGTVVGHPFNSPSKTKFVPHNKHMEQSKLDQQSRFILPSKPHQRSKSDQQSKSPKQSRPYQRINLHQQAEQRQKPKPMGADHPLAASLELETRYDNFMEWVQTYQGALSQYCRSLVGTSWEAEDLVQETWLKVWRISLEKDSHFSVNKSYLYRIANHICIDGHRKNRVFAESYSIDQTVADELQAEEVDVTSLWMAMETIVNRLPIHQRITLMLMDVFRYTAAETAELLSTTEGAVKALLHRARTKLRSVRAEEEADQGSRLEKRNDLAHATPNNEQIVYAYLKAFREHNPMALLMLMNESSELDQIQPPVLKKHRQQDARHQNGLKAAYSQTLVWAA